MTELLVHPRRRARMGRSLRVTPGVGRLGLRRLRGARARCRRATRQPRHAASREVCIVVVSGQRDVAPSTASGATSAAGPIPGRGRPMPPTCRRVTTRRDATATGEVALCWAPAPGGGAAARPLPGDEIDVETRGLRRARALRSTRSSWPTREAESLLVCEVLTPAGHWSSYPPHKHDRDDPPDARPSSRRPTTTASRPRQGFGLQRVYTDDRSLDETLASATATACSCRAATTRSRRRPATTVYYLNVMAGPTRLWAVANDPDHEWTLPAAMTACIRSTRHPSARQLHRRRVDSGRPTHRTSSTSSTPPPARRWRACRCRARPTSTRPCARRATALPAWRAVSTIARARKLFELRERPGRAPRGPRPLGHDRDGQDARRRARRGRAHDRDGRGRVRDPDDDAGPDPRGRLAQHRRRDDPPARRRVRGDRARSTSRRWCRSGSCPSRSPAATRSCSSPPSRCR